MYISITRTPCIIHVAVDWWTVAVHYLGDLAIMAFRGNWFASEIQIISTFVPSVHYTLQFWK
jgi:hypothetical protein